MVFSYFNHQPHNGSRNHLARREMIENQGILWLRTIKFKKSATFSFLLFSFLCLLSSPGASVRPSVRHFLEL